SAILLWVPLVKALAADEMPDPGADGGQGDQHVGGQAKGFWQVAVPAEQPYQGGGIAAQLEDQGDSVEVAAVPQPEVGQQQGDEEDGYQPADQLVGQQADGEQAMTPGIEQFAAPHQALQALGGDPVATAELVAGAFHAGIHHAGPFGEDDAPAGHRGAGGQEEVVGHVAWHRLEQLAAQRLQSAVGRGHAAGAAFQAAQPGFVGTIGAIAQGQGLAFVGNGHVAGHGAYPQVGEGGDQLGQGVGAPLGV